MLFCNYVVIGLKSLKYKQEKIVDQAAMDAQNKITKKKQLKFETFEGYIFSV